MSLYSSIPIALLVLGLTVFIYRKLKTKRALKVIPRWVVRKYGNGTKDVYFCVEIWNNGIVPVTLDSLNFSTTKHGDQLFEMVQTLDDHAIPISIGSGQKIIAAFKDTKISRIAFQHLSNVSASLSNGYTEEVSPSGIEFFLSSYQAEIDKEKSCNPHNPTTINCVE